MSCSKKTTWNPGTALLVGILLLAARGSMARADFTFGKAANLGPTVNSSANDRCAVLSPDGLELYFGSERSGGYGGEDIWVSKRASAQDAWSPPVNVGAQVNTSAGYEKPASISADGLTLYFDSNAPGGYGNEDLYVTTRATKDSPWGPSVNLGPIVNSPEGDASPVISPDDLELYFTSYRLGGYGGWDTWVSTRASTSAPWSTPVSVNLGRTLNTATESASCALPGGLTLLFQAGPGRIERSSSYDMWMVTRPSISSPWGPPMNLGPSINTVYSEHITGISPDGQWCYFDDAPPGTWAGGVGGYDLWQASIIPIVDFNADGIVDIDDLVTLIEHWGQADSQCDIGPMPWGDGKVDAADLEAFMSHWGEEPRLLAAWKFDETEGHTAHDSAGDYEGTLRGGPLWQPAGGVTGGTLRLDGADDYVETPFVLDPTAGSFSVFAWVKGGVAGQVVLSQVGGADWLATASTGALMTDLKVPRIGKPLSSQAVITDDQWHEVGFVQDGARRVLYVDGVEVAKDMQTGTGTPATGGLHIGADSKLAGGSFWSGLIDDVRVYNRAVKP